MSSIYSTTSRRVALRINDSASRQALGRAQSRRPVANRKRAVTASDILRYPLSTGDRRATLHFKMRSLQCRVIFFDKFMQQPNARLPPVRRQLPAAIDPRAEISPAGLPSAARPTSGFSPALPSAAGDRYRSSQRSSKRDPL
jgi:hypothetical protein